MRRSARYYDNRVPDSLVRPRRLRPKRFEHWTYLEQSEYRHLVSENYDELDHIYKTHTLPEGWTHKKAVELQKMKILSQRTSPEGEKYWDLHKWIKEDWDE